ncbi:Membrane metallo-endopeptidase-like 1 [Stylophora pistillata]|uniref:Membrane metallo-endopeptidase-like 1 n=1 Tax=Stylophora pistillata TaxID=50429 RepID=A0A2B4STT4_STYPI|nr:Membrane metallo-endopeptidase-like 1 [Stylophora pistillata]
MCPEVMAMISDLKETFIANLDKLGWMDNKTRAYAKEKASAIRQNIGYPEYMKDKRKLSERFKDESDERKEQQQQERAQMITKRRKREREREEQEAMQRKSVKVNEPGERIRDIYMMNEGETFGETGGEEKVEKASVENIASTQIDPEGYSRSCSTHTEECDYMFRTQKTWLPQKSTAFEEDYFEGDNEKVRFYAGLPSLEILKKIFSFLSPRVTRRPLLLSKLHEFVLVLIKLRLRVPSQDLAYRFNVSRTVVSRIIVSWLTVMEVTLSSLISWPDREELQRTMPRCFIDSFGLKTCVIIDCFEVFIDRSSNLFARAQKFSNYKHHNTIKVLIGITPQGTISFVSEAWGGRTSDKFLIQKCGFLKNLVPGDLVLADRGFTVHEEVWFRQAEINIPAVAKGKNHLDPVDIEKTRKIVNVRIHVERVIGVHRQKYTILQSTLPTEFLTCNQGNQIPLIGRMVRVCSALFNLCPPIVPFD